MKFFFSFLFAFFLGALSMAQEVSFKPLAKNDIAATIGNMQKASAALTSLQCAFTQRKTIAVLSETVVSKGKLLYKKENKLCWEYDSPYFYLFALNGDKVYIKNDKSTKQFDTKSNALFKEISSLLVSSINGTGFIDPKKFDAAFYENTGTILVKLTPKNKALKSMMATISLHFDKNSFMVHTIELKEPSGDNTIILFQDMKFNKHIDDEKFVVN